MKFHSKIFLLIFAVFLLGFLGYYIDYKKPLDPLAFNLPKTAKEIIAKRTDRTATFEITFGKFAQVSRSSKINKSFFLASAVGPSGPGTVENDASYGTASWFAGALDLVKVENEGGVGAGAYSIVGTTGVGPGCLLEGVKVATEYGDKLIQDLQTVDLVYSYNSTNNQKELKRVGNIIKKSITEVGSKYYHIYFEGGDIKVTADHLFYVAGNYVSAENLKSGDILLSDDNSQKIITNIIVESDSASYIYDISVADNHNYYANNILVHNTGVYDSRVSIVKGGVVGNDNKADAANWPGDFTYQPGSGYGSTNDLWGETWTASDINASNFGFVISAYGTGYSGSNLTSNYLKLTNFGFNVSGVIDGIVVQVKKKIIQDIQVSANVDYATITIYYSAGPANNAPAITDGPFDGSSSSSVPTTAGSNVTFTATATDTESDNYYLAICKTNSITANNNAQPTCTDGNWCISNSTASSLQTSCNYTTLSGDSESNTWYGFVCDYNASSLCSASNQGSGDAGSPFNVNHAPSFTSINNTSGYIKQGSSVTFTSAASDSDTDTTSDTVTLYVCKANDFTGSACGAGGEWCHSSAGSSNPTCSYTVQSSDTDGSHNYYSNIIDNHNLQSSSNPRSSSFNVDSTPPTNVGISSITADSTTQLTVTASTATDSGSGLHATPYYFAETTGNPGASSSSDYQSSTVFVDSGLSANTLYTYKVKARDALGNVSDYSTTSSKYTLAETPTNLQSTSQTQSTIDLSTTRFSNDTTASSGYYFENTTNNHNSSWIQTNTWQDTSLNCGTSYTYTVKYRNSNATGTTTTQLTVSTATCGGGNAGAVSPPVSKISTLPPPPPPPPVTPVVLPIEPIKPIEPIESETTPQSKSETKETLKPPSVTESDLQLNAQPQTQVQNQPEVQSQSQPKQQFQIQSNFLGTVQVVKEILNKPEFVATTKAVTTAGVVVGVIPSLFDLLSMPFRLLGLLFTVFGIKKRVLPWGAVYDSVTKQPLDPVRVSLKSYINNKEINSAITDLDGRYGFLVEKGEYIIEAHKTNYIFPSKNLAGKTEDELYKDLYFGEKFQVTESGQAIAKNIPLDPVDFNFNEFVKKNQKLNKFWSRWDVSLRIFSDVFFIFGFFVAIIAYFAAPYPYNTVIMGLYVFLGILILLGLRPKNLGYIIEKATGYPIPFAIVRVLIPPYNVEFSHKVTDKRGRYFCLAPKGEYFVKVEKKNENGSYSVIYTSPTMNGKKQGIVRKKIKI